MSGFRLPADTREYGPFVVEFVKDAWGRPFSVFVRGRGKTGHDLDHILYDLSVDVSSFMQGEAA